MECFFDPDHRSLRERIRAWVEKNILRESKSESDVDGEARKLARELGRDGFTAYVAPKSF
ncbi:MAG: hypothetical protein HYV04_22735, partial [Deltaproteobacteria bacterium]|nr:hypothetical protein [Deltaproteobacteria bacterium]